MENLKIWWKKVGIWQTGMALVTLAVFFIILCIIGDSKEAAPIAVGLTTAFAGVAFASVAISAALTTSPAAFTVASAALVALAAAFIAISAALTTFAFVAYEGHMGIRKKAVWLSSAAEFVVIFIPMFVKIWG